MQIPEDNYREVEPKTLQFSSNYEFRARNVYSSNGDVITK